MTWRTIKEWNEKGRMVKKGEKSRLRCPDSGDALFCKKQTKKRKVLLSNYGDWYDCDRQGEYSCLYPGEDYDEMDYDLGLCGQI